MSALAVFIEHIVLVVRELFVWDVFFAQGARLIEYSSLKFGIASRVFDAYMGAA